VWYAGSRYRRGYRASRDDQGWYTRVEKSPPPKGAWSGNNERDIVWVRLIREKRRKSPVTGEAGEAFPDVKRRKQMINGKRSGNSSTSQEGWQEGERKFVENTGVMELCANGKLRGEWTGVSEGATKRNGPYCGGEFGGSRGICFL